MFPTLHKQPVKAIGQLLEETVGFLSDLKRKGKDSGLIPRVQENVPTTDAIEEKQQIVQQLERKMPDHLTVNTIKTESSVGRLTRYHLHYCRNTAITLYDTVCRNGQLKIKLY